MPITKVDTSSNPVSTRSLSIQSNSGRTPSYKKPEKPEKSESESPVEEEDSAAGVSKDKCALAMSFFANNSKPAKKSPKPPPKKPEKYPESGSDLPNVQNNTAKPFMRERAYYEPDDEELPEDENDLIPDFTNRNRKSSTASKSENSENSEISAPPIPARSEDNKSAMMLRLMKNATNALRS